MVIVLIVLTYNHLRFRTNNRRLDIDRILRINMDRRRLDIDLFSSFIIDVLIDQSTCDDSGKSSLFARSPRVSRHRSASDDCDYNFLHFISLD